MSFAQVLYRFNQFRRAIRDKPASEDLEAVRRVLEPEQLALFQRLQPEEQAHSIRVFRRVWSRTDRTLNDENRALFVAALLHDVGKVRYPLRIWERVLIVLVKAFFPSLVKRWGAEEVNTTGVTSNPLGWRRPFVVSEQHARWGAEMAAEAGAPPLTVSLILNHQNLFPSKIVSIEDRLLNELQSADRKS